MAAASFSTYFYVTFISFLGIFFGSLLALFTKEEMPSGKKHFSILKDFILAILFFLAIYPFNLNLILLILLSFTVFISSNLIKTIISERIHSIIQYSLIGILLFFSSQNLSFFLASASIVFFFGLVMSSYNFNEKHGFLKNLQNLSFSLLIPIISIILFAVNVYFKIV